MVIKLQHIERRWHVVHPAKSAPQLTALDLMYAYYDAA